MWIDQCHAPPAPGDAVIADNLSVHEVRPERILLEDARTELLFLPYSPKSNPVETVLAGCKHRFERPTNAPRRHRGAGSGLSSTSLPPTSARDAFVMPAMRQPKMNTLQFPKEHH